MDKLPLNELEVGLKVYTYRTDRPFVISGFSRYALNCTIQMIHFNNLLPTDDAPVGQTWTLEEDIFRKQFYTKDEG